ncbi:hypothetical protein E3E36_00400 [Thermococcus sp. M36]|nr:hypothetical protein [Thermococcus sp. M36]
MKRVVPLLLIILLVPVGYYIASSGGDAMEAPSRGEGITDVPAKDGPTIVEPPKNGAIILKLDKTVYFPSDTMTLTIINNANINATTSYHFKLYKLEGGEWKEVPVNLMFIEIAVVIELGKSWEQKVKLSDLSLTPGHYRIEKTVVVTDPVNKMAMGIKAWAEFEVKG